MRRLERLAVCSALTCVTLSAGAAPFPRSPSTLQVGPPVITGPEARVDSSSGLREALENAIPGGVVVLDANASFEGPFVLPSRPAALGTWVVLRSSAMAQLPPFGRRVSPSDGAHMPSLFAQRGPVLIAAPGAHHYRVIGLEFRPAADRALANLVELGDRNMRGEELPHHIVFDRCYLHGDPTRGSRRGIALEGRALAVVGSHLSDFKTAGQDSQALAGWSGPGPFLIENNTLQAAGENIMFGGADPPDPSRIPSDIEVRGNHLCKPLAWRDGAERGRWTVKNLFELKNARRVRVEGNVLEQNWVGAQNGFAVLLTVRNQEGGAPWSVVEDVAFVGNVVRHSAAGINILGHDDSQGDTGQTRRLLIRDNIFDDLGTEPWGGGGTLLQILRGTEDVVFEHNTATQCGTMIMAEGAPHRGFVFRSNVVRHNLYGVIGTGTGTGLQTLETYFPALTFGGNVIIGGDPSRYPPDNAFLPDDAPGYSCRPGTGLDSPARPGTSASGAGADRKALLPLLEVTCR